MYIASGSIFRGNKRDTVKFFQWDYLIFGKGMSFRKDRKQLVIHNGKELIAMSLLAADKTDIHSPFLNPVCEFALGSFNNFEMDVRMSMMEFLDDPGDPVDGAA